jgi:sulfite reductase beta subunit-like hemoprotein
VHAQRQAGFVTATVTIPLGDLSSAQWRVIALLAGAFSDGTVRLTATQNLVLRWVDERALSALYDGLAAAGLGQSGADSAADVTSCPGAESCKLAVTQSRGLGQALSEHLRRSPGLLTEAPGLDVKVSGCPNGCGQHHIAAIGFQGSLRKIGQRAAPQYFVMAGGGVNENGASFGQLVAKIPARRAPVALERLTRLYASERREGETAEVFFTRVGKARLSSLLADLEPLPAEAASPEDFIDFAETGPFRPDTQEGECAV